MHIKLSGAYGLGDLHAGALARLWLAELGSGRLLWGSDWPCTNHEAHAAYPALWHALDEGLRNAAAAQAARVDNPHHLLRGDLARARTAVDASLALRPTPEAHALAGSIAWVGGDRDRARSQWRAALALDPLHPGVAEALSRSETAPLPEAGKALPR